MRNPMDAGRELDALVAEKVMGWVWRRWPVKHGPTPALKLLWQIDAARYSNDGLGITLPLLGDEVPADDAARDVPRYSTDIASAWLVVERFDTCEVKRWFDGADFYWTTSLTRYDPEVFQPHDVRVETAPLAICLAALEALGAYPSGNSSLGASGTTG